MPGSRSRRARRPSKKRRSRRRHSFRGAFRSKTRESIEKAREKRSSGVLSRTARDTRVSANRANALIHLHKEMHLLDELDDDSANRANALIDTLQEMHLLGQLDETTFRPYVPVLLLALERESYIVGSLKYGSILELLDQNKQWLKPEFVERIRTIQNDAWQRNQAQINVVYNPPPPSPNGDMEDS